MAHIQHVAPKDRMPLHSDGGLLGLACAVHRPYAPRRLRRQQNCRVHPAFVIIENTSARMRTTARVGLGPSMSHIQHRAVLVIDLLQYFERIVITQRSDDSQVVSSLLM